MIDYGFPQRSIEAFLRAVEYKRICPRHVDDVIRWCKGKDITVIEDLLNAEDSWTRMSVVQIIGKIGDKKKLIEAAKKEQDKNVLFAMMKSLMSCKEGMEELVCLLESSDTAIKQQAIQMFRNAGRADCLFSLVFNGDDETVKRIKKYIDEADGKQEDSSSQ